MPLFSLLISALAIVMGSLFILIVGSYLAYRIKRKSNLTQQNYYR